MKDKQCYKCDKFNYFQEACLDNKVSVKANYGCAVSSLKPRPSLPYLEAKINRRNVSYLVYIGATHYFMIPKLAKRVGLANAMGLSEFELNNSLHHPLKGIVPTKVTPISQMFSTV